MSLLDPALQAPASTIIPALYVVYKYAGLGPDGQPILQPVALAPTFDGAEQFTIDNKMSAYAIGVSLTIRERGIPRVDPSRVAGLVGN